MSKTLAALGLVLCVIGAYRTYFHWGAQPGVSRAAQLADQGYRSLWAGKANGPGGAIESFQQALVADAGSPYRWADLGAAYLEAGDRAKAAYCFDQARARSPRSPQILIRSANFAQAIGDREAVLRHTALLLDGVSTYDDTAFGIWEQMEIPALEALASAIGKNRRSHVSFLRYLIRNKKMLGAAAVWEKLPDPEPDLVSDYADALVATGDPARAAAVHRRSSAVSELVINGSFESQWTGKGLDWAVIPIEGVAVERDSVPSGQALRLRFPAIENIEYKHTGQRLWIPSGGPYKLRARMRSDGLTTDQGLALRVVDGSNELARTQPVLGTTDWHDVQAVLAVGGPRLLRLEVHRAKSWKFDGKPRGTVWIDDVRLEPGS